MSAGNLQVLGANIVPRCGQARSRVGGRIIAQRARRIVIHSIVAGIGLSGIAMTFAAFGLANASGRRSDEGGHRRRCDPQRAAGAHTLMAPTPGRTAEQDGTRLE